MAKWLRVPIQFYFICFGLLKEFFLGEFAYAVEPSLRYLRKWRILIACLSLAALSITLHVGAEWKDTRSDSYSDYEGRLLEREISNVRSEIRRQEQLIKEITSDAQKRTETLIALQSDFRVMSQKLDWIGVLIGVVILAMLTEVFLDFYRARLKGTQRFDKQ